MALIQNPKANAEWKKRSEEERRRLIQLASEHRTMSGRTFDETTALPKNAKYGYEDFISKKTKILSSGESDSGKLAEDVSSARKTGYYAKKYIQQNAEQYDKDNGAGSSQMMIESLDNALKELDDYQSRVFDKNQQTQVDTAKKAYDRNVERAAAIKEAAYEQAKEQGMPDSLKSFQERGNQSIRDIAAYKRKQELNRLAQAALEASKNQSNNGGTPVVNGHGAGLGRSFGDPTQLAIRSEQNTGMSEQLREKRNELASGLQNYSPKQSQAIAPVQEHGKSTTFQNSEDAAAYYGINPELKKKLDAEALAKSQTAGSQPSLHAAPTFNPKIDPSMYENKLSEESLKKQQNQIAANDNKISSYSSAKNNADFQSTVSDFMQNTSTEYAGIVKNANSSDRAIFDDVLSVDGIIPMFGSIPDAANGLPGTLDNGRARQSAIAKQMTDDERKTYYYVVKTQGLTAATDYFNTLTSLSTNSLNERLYNKNQTELEQFGTEHPGLATFNSIMAAPFKIAGTAYSVWQGITGQTIDPYASNFEGTQLSGTLRSTARAKINDDLKETPFLQGVALFGYDALTSSLESLEQVAMGGSSAGGLTMFGASAASDAIQDAKLRGGSDVQALLVGGVTAFAEVATEKIPMDEILGAFKAKGAEGIKGLIKRAARSALEEGPGEAISEWIEEQSDSEIMGEMSNASQSINQYMQSGMTRKEAEEKAYGDVINNCIRAAAIGALSGAGSTAISYGAGVILNGGKVNPDGSTDESASSDPAASSPAMGLLPSGNVESQSEVPQEIAQDEINPAEEPKHTLEQAAQEAAQQEHPEQEISMPVEAQNSPAEASAYEPEQVEDTSIAPATAPNVVEKPAVQSKKPATEETKNEYGYSPDVMNRLEKTASVLDDEKVAKSFLKNYDKNTGLSPEEYGLAYLNAYAKSKSADYKKIGDTEDVNRFIEELYKGSGLDPYSFYSAYNAGQEARYAELQSAKRAAENKPSAIKPVSSPESVKQQPALIKPTAAAVKLMNKWIENEYVNIKPSTGDPRESKFKRFFDKYYNAGRNGTRTTQIPFDADTDTEFPVFLQDVFYRAGVKDASTEKPAAAESKPAAPAKNTGESGARLYPADKTNLPYDIVVEKLDTSKYEQGASLTKDSSADTMKADEQPTTKGGKRNGGTQERIEPANDRETSGAGQGSGTVLAGVVQAELPKFSQEGPAGSVPVLRGAGDEGAQSSGGHDAGRHGGGRGDGDRSGVSDTAAGERLTQETPEQAIKRDTERKTAETPKGSNYAIGESLNLPNGEKSRYKANVEAIRTVKRLIAEGRYATTEEQETLSRYVGWGGIANAFDESKSEWAKEYAELKELLTNEEYESARGSTLNAHYTSIEVIRAMYNSLGKLGFDGGRMLEPACGVGNFVGAMPAEMRGKVKSWTMVELDQVTGNIAKYLYPNNDVRVQGFETAKIPDNYMDVAISNVPFGNYAITDKHYSHDETSSIHNYFFAKTLDKVRPGGVVMFITSRYTMDGRDNGFRAKMAGKADLLGAVRLPDTAFKGNAGTEVVTDILVLRKRDANTPSQGESFVDVGWERLSEQYEEINEYYKQHPEMVLGTPERTGSMYGKNQLTYKAKPGDLAQQIEDALGTITEKMAYPKRPSAETTARDTARAANGGKEGQYVHRNGKIYQVLDGLEIQVQADAAQATKIAGMISIRDQARALLGEQMTGADASKIAKGRKQLNDAYNAFVKENGYINTPNNRRLVADDVDAPFLLALENYDKNTKTATKADIFTKDTVTPRKTVTHVNDATEGLVVSVNETGDVDMPMIARLTGTSEAEVESTLSDAGLVFMNREGAWETAERYLSGNVKAKLRDARALAEMDRRYQKNVDALEKVVPKDISFGDIYVKPGATWVPPEVYTQFVTELLKVYGYGRRVQVQYAAGLGEYVVKLDTRAAGSVENRSTYGSKARSFDELFEAVLNNRQVTVRYKTEDGTSHVDQEATIEARAKMEEITDAFKEWVWKDEARRDQLSTLYNEVFNNTVTPKYDGSTLTVDGANPAKSLKPHQRDVVQRIISSGGNTLIAHKVGAGKTGEMAAAAMKLRQLGIVKKPMFVVPKNVLAQWGKEFLSFFPTARILIPNESDFTAANRRTFMNKIATGDYDAVIVSQENFSSIPVSGETQGQFLQEQINELMAAIEAEKLNKAGNSITVKQMEKRKKQLEAKLGTLGDLKKDVGNIDFESLGVDSLFVDEAHSYKNLFYSTHMNNVSGLSNKDGAKRSFDMYMKVRWLQQLNAGRGIVFATATPIMNSMSEMYIMQKYLQGDALKQRGLDTFDAWANTFGEVVNVMEMNPSGMGYRQKQSFSRFKNLGELQQMFRSFTDVLTDVPGLKIPKLKGGKRTTVVCAPSDFQLDYIQKLSDRADAVKNGVDPRIDNMLKITSEGRKLSYSQRMIDPSLPYEADGKINKLVGTVYDKWVSTKATNGTQLVFCDMATPKGSSQSADADTGAEDAENADIYNDVRRQLMLKGIPAKEIAFIHDADTNEKKESLFADVNAGRVRVLIGSTGKMGVGMNAQQRVVALHHLDAPWRPGDIEQREGRALRQGNMNDEVEIFVYVTEKTFDARMWDTLERKSSFISDVMNGNTDVRETEDVGELTLSAAEIKSIASGNPMIMEQFEVTADITKLKALKNKHSEGVMDATREKRDYLADIANAKAAMPKFKADAAKAADVSGDEFSIIVNGETYTDRKAAGAAIIRAASAAAKKGSTKIDEIGTFAGFELSVMGDGTIFIRGQAPHNAKINPDSPIGTIQSMEATLKGMKNATEKLEARIAEANERISKLDELINAPYARQAELDKAMKRNREIMDILNPSKGSEQVLDDGAEAETESNKTENMPRSNMLDTGGTEQWQTERAGADRPVVGIDAILRKARQKFGLPITSGHIRGSQIRGQYSQQSVSIRTKIANDLPAASHEIGHYLNAKYKLLREMNLDAKNELLRGLDPQIKAAFQDNPNQMLSEAFAEYLRKYLQNRETAQIDFPGATLHMKNTLDADTLNTIDELADDVNAYYSLGEQNAQPELMTRKESTIDNSALKDKILAVEDRLYLEWVDANIGIRKFDRAAGSKAYIYATNSAYADSISGEILSGDLYDMDGNFISDGLRKTLADIKVGNKEEYAAFNEYLVVRHGPERLKEGMRVFANDKKNSTVWMNRRMNELEEEYPAFKEAANKLYTFQKTFLKTWGVKAGLVSEDAANEWAKRWEFYVPFSRAMDKDGNAVGARRGYANQDSTIRKAHGSGRSLVMPVDNIITNMVRMVNAAQRNHVMQELVNASEDVAGMGRFLEEVPAPMKRTTIDLDPIKQKMVESVLEANPEDMDSFLQMIQSFDDVAYQYEQGKAKGDVVTVLRNGKQEFYKVNDPLLLKSLVNMAPKQSSALLDSYGKITRFITANITGFNVVWSLFSNLPRDVGSYMFYSKDKNPIPLFGGIASAYLNMFKGKNADPMYKEYKAMGGGKTSAYTADTNLQRNLMRDFSGSKAKWLNPLNWLEFISNMIESGPRYATYRLMRTKYGMSPAEAFYESNDITVNFRRGGTMSRQATKVVQYFNASIQSLDKFSRHISGEEFSGTARKKASTIRVVGLILVSLLGAALSHGINSGDDEKKKEYAQLSTYTKNSFFCFPLGGGKYFAVPKPRELTVLSSFMERALELYENGNKDAFNGFYNYAAETSLPNVLSGIAQGDLFNAVSSLGAVGVFTSVAANKDFLGRPIESQSMQNLLPTERFTRRTSVAAKAIGDVFGISPLQVDYVAKNILGGFWKWNQALFPIGKENVDYTLGVANSYVKDNQYSTDIINTLYDNYEDATLKKNSTHDPEAAMKYKLLYNMTTFYTNYNKLSKDEPNADRGRAYRQTVLDMLEGVNQYAKNGPNTPEIKALADFVKRNSGTEQYPTALSPSVKDKSGLVHDLTASQYVDYQTDYLRRYWDYAGKVLASPETATEDGMKSAKAQARSEAETQILSTIGADSADANSLQTAGSIGLTSKNIIDFNAAKATASADGSFTKEEAMAILNKMQATDTQKAFFYKEANGNATIASNPYSSVNDLNKYLLTADPAKAKQSITNSYKDLIVSSYMAGDTESLAKYTNKLLSLDLLDKKGNPYYTQEMIDGWIDDYLKK